MYRDSGGRITDYEKTAMQRVGHVDVALAAVAADVLDSLTSRRALEYLRTYKPDVYIPAHHDADRNGMWRPTEPIFQALKEEDPKLITISKQYREPICFDTESSVQHGKRKYSRSRFGRAFVGSCIYRDAPFATQADGFPNSQNILS